MSIPERLARLETICQSSGVTMEAVCEAAEIQYSTYWRWRVGDRRPGLETWERFEAAVRKLCGEAP